MLEPGGPSATVTLAFLTCAPTDYLLPSSAMHAKHAVTVAGLMLLILLPDRCLLIIWHWCLTQGREVFSVHSYSLLPVCVSR